MKNIHLLYTLLFSFLGLACSQQIDEKWADLAPLNPSNLDANAGTWQPIVLSTQAEIALPAPPAPNSAQYQQELQATKAALANLSPQQAQIIQYWSAGVTLRWNEIMRELVAKHNLPPVANPDGTYPIPNSANPFAYPQFPFANPPYAARAYAYVSVAQYDALVAAYHYKNLYQTQAPYQIDNTIQPRVPKSTLAAYPCQDAVIAAASLELMKFLFPTEVDYLNQKAYEAMYYKMWAGAAVESDILAGEALGKAVAQKVLTRARNDNMRNAVGTQVKWDSLVNRVRTMGGTPWQSLENPARPPMLPFFGQVKTWLFDTNTLAQIRPEAPYAIGSPEFQAQLAEVKREAGSNDRDKLRIVHYWADGAGTYTPPGHWNALAADYIQQAQQSEVRTARNFALLNMAMMDAGVACWEAKTYYYFPRPSQIDPSIKTLTGVPNFPAYTSGHSTFSYTAATVLGHLFPNQKNQLEAMALEASLSRLYGGIHYRMDCEAGARCGKVIGGYAVARAQTDGAGN
ncbi:MAG: phosphatase PAP2 family protein [Microscillaceae bacterium]|jgi:hypothetical protein|nr:phosphatase PAP2 family protein [Microscillaceae bacterium]